MIYNSTSNSRGVAILISTKYDYKINYTYKDSSENILCLNMSINGSNLNIGSIYGPNRNEEAFFIDLSRFLAMFSDCPTILGGDWNSTFSTVTTRDNLDIFRMAAPPSSFRSGKIADLCELHNMTDPFRVLYPDLRDYTFRPRADRANRSRLDFFLISDSLLDCISNCKISPYLSSELFDHKFVTLTLNKPTFKQSVSINHSIIFNPRLPDVILAATVDCFLQHAVPDPAYNLDRGLVEVGNFIRIMRDLNNNELSLALNKDDNNLIVTNRRLNDLLAEQRRLLPTPDQLNILVLDCEPDLFLDVLVNNIRNEIISFQSWAHKANNIKKSSLIKTLDSLKQDYLANGAEIADLESSLNELVDNELKNKIKNMKLFEGLNSEKPSAMFLSIAKKRNVGKLSGIKNNDNSPFLSTEDREEFIVKFYEQLYKKPADEPECLAGCIEDFLGPDILNSDLVSNSKLTAAESADLERPLSIEELDNALKEGNQKSAPGSDGLSIPLIKMCWHFLRIPLYNYTNCCYNKGILTEKFRSASIRLIPKKNDLGNIKNWRPISLLSNLYKIVSRALNNRLANYVNRITSRAQKGFNSTRYTQEAIINVWESIAYCKSKKIRAAILAMDMEKAFDTISLKYLDEVYKFFGIGPNMCRWLKLIGNERFASILLDDGNLSRCFKLERGRPQGDIISPLTFNFCIQILIFKLELDPRIKKIPRQVPVYEHNIVNALPTNINSSFFMHESKRETSKNEAMADDNTTITLIELACFAALRQVLADFGRISGLRCNVSKSIIMPVFDPTAEEEDLISNLGFILSDKITLLGVEISRNLNNLDDIFNKIKLKIIDLISFWERFKLSLPGRLVISKTYLISQLCYLGSFLPVPVEIKTDIQTVIDGFIRKNLRISQDRFYLPPNLGGVGAIDIDKFLTAQGCAWVKRAFNMCIDNWRFDLTVGCPENNILALRSSYFNPEVSPILHNLASCYEKFYDAYTLINENFRDAYVFENRCFKRNRLSNEIIDRNFFSREFFSNNSSKISNLKFSEFFSNGRIKDLAAIHDSGLPITAATWLALQAAGSLAWSTMKKHTQLEEISVPIETLLKKKFKGSRLYRSILDRKNLAGADPTNLTIVQSFADLTDTEVQSIDITKRCLGGWNHYATENLFREFVFKQRNNQLRTNNRLHAIDPNIDPRCSFCRIIDNDTNTRETFGHLFFTCPVTSALLNALAQKLEPRIPRILSCLKICTGTVDLMKIRQLRVFYYFF
jgi:exonuclease III